MARTTNGSSDYIDGGVIAGMSGLTRATIAGWVYRSAAGTTASFGLYLDPYRFSTVWFSNDNFYTYGEAGGAQAYVNTDPQAVAGWHHVAIVFTGYGATNATRLTTYLDGNALANTGVTGTVTTSLGAGANNPPFRCGMDSTTRFWNGSYANMAAWGESLSAAEIALLARQRLSPLNVRPQSLLAFWPLSGRYSPEPSLIAHNRNPATLNGTTVRTGEPVLRLRTPKRVLGKAGAAGAVTAHNLTLLGCGS